VHQHSTLFCDGFGNCCSLMRQGREGVHSESASQQHFIPHAEAEASAARERAGGSGMITGLRQRILAYLCHALRHPVAGRLLEAGGDGGGSGGGGGGVAGGLEAQRSHSAAIDGRGGGGGHAESAAGQRPPRDRFILHFDSFNSLVVWKVGAWSRG